MVIIYISLFAVVGALARYLINGFLISISFPLSTLLVNFLGSLVIGLAYAMQQKGQFWVSEAFHMGLVVGLLGALTTFSGFSLDNLKLLEQGQLGVLATNIGLSLLLCLGGCFLAFKYGLRAFN